MKHDKTLANVRSAEPTMGDSAIFWPTWVVAAMAVAVVGALGGAALAMNLAPFEFRFNPYAGLSLVALVISLVVFGLVVRIQTRTEGQVWFALHLFALGLWAAAEMFARLSAIPDTASFWLAARALGACLVPVGFFMFAMSYVRRQSRPTFVIVPLLVVTLLLLLVEYRTNFFNVYDPLTLMEMPWGYIMRAGQYYSVVVGWTLGLGALSLAMFAWAWRQSSQPASRRQARLFCLAILIPLVGGGLVDGILPMLGADEVLPLAVPLTAAMGAVIGYGIWRYRSFTFDRTAAAANILDTMNEAVIGMRPDLTVNYVNPAAEHLLGYPAAKFTKLRFTELLTQEWDTRILKKALVEPLGRHRNSKFDSIDLRTAAGRVLTAKLSISMVSPHDELDGYVVVITDISKIARATELIERAVTERTREVQETKATLVTSINSLDLGYVVINPMGEVVRLNTIAHDMFCVHKHSHMAGECHEVELAHVQALMGSEVKLAAEIQTCLRRQLPHEIKDVAFKGKNWRVYLSPMVVERDAIGCVVLLQDTTEEHLLQRSRDEFFSIASHELRTPLTSIKGNSSMIMRYYGDSLKDPALREMVSDIHESSDRLIEIVNDFLDVSRLEQGRIEFHLEQLGLSKIVEEVAYGMNALIKQKQIYLRLGDSLRRTDALPVVIADKNRLKQILFNLLGNATKFTEHGGITVEAEESQGVVHIMVKDTGAGISPESQALLFHKFQQAGDSILTRDTTHGTGLGLYISRMLAEGMGGTLKLEQSAPGKGSVFGLTLLVATPARLAQMPKGTKQVDLQTGLMKEDESQAHRQGR